MGRRAVNANDQTIEADFDDPKVSGSPVPCGMAKKKTPGDASTPSGSPGGPPGKKQRRKARKNNKTNK